MHHIFTRTIADVHGGRERPEPKVAGRRERQRGSTSPAEGKGNGATRRRPKGKATGQQGTLEIPFANVSSCPCRARTMRLFTQGATPPSAPFALG